MRVYVYFLKQVQWKRRDFRDGVRQTEAYFPNSATFLFNSQIECDVHTLEACHNPDFREMCKLYKNQCSSASHASHSLPCASKTENAIIHSYFNGFFVTLFLSRWTIATLFPSQCSSVAICLHRWLKMQKAKFRTHISSHFSVQPNACYICETGKKSPPRAKRQSSRVCRLQRESELYKRIRTNEFWGEKKSRIFNAISA